MAAGEAIPWEDLTERQQRNIQTDLYKQGIKVTLDEAKEYYGNPEKADA